jgi:tRNA pseudouridine55 synthase
MPVSRQFAILNVSKPAGITSRRVVDRVTQLVGPLKVGHAGTLDPLATGVIVVCLGKATRLIETIQQQRKSYHAQFLLGRESDTDDVTGNVTPVAECRTIGQAEVESALPAFVGRIEQTPPQFSAVHVDGGRAYEKARAGMAVDLAPRPVDVYRLELTRFAYPEFELAIECGSGTYVRSIGRDLGRALGSGAAMSALVRTRIGPYHIEEAVPLDNLTPQTIDESLLPTTTAVSELPQYHATADDVARIRAGRSIDTTSGFDSPPDASIAMLNANDDLLCLAEFDPATKQLLPRRVFLD